MVVLSPTAIVTRKSRPSYHIRKDAEQLVNAVISYTRMSNVDEDCNILLLSFVPPQSARMSYIGNLGGKRFARGTSDAMALLVRHMHIA